MRSYIEDVTLCASVTEVEQRPEVEDMKTASDVALDKVILPSEL